MGSIQNTNAQVNTGLEILLTGDKTEDQTWTIHPLVTSTIRAKTHCYYLNLIKSLNIPLINAVQVNIAIETTVM